MPVTQRAIGERGAIDPDGEIMNKAKCAANGLYILKAGGVGHFPFLLRRSTRRSVFRR